MENFILASGKNTAYNLRSCNLLCDASSPDLYRINLAKMSSIRVVLDLAATLTWKSSNSTSKHHFSMVTWRRISTWSNQKDLWSQAKRIWCADYKRVSMA